MPIKNMNARIPRAGLIRLGSPKGQNSPGRNLSYFRIETAYFSEEDLKKAFGAEPKELRIKFPRIDKSDDQKSLDFIFDASYKAYKAGALFCKGDGESATRAVAKGKLETVACTCEYLTGKTPICKQRGDLKVILCDLPFLGFFGIGTSSWNSINSIESVINMYHQVLGEKFWITEFILFKEETFLKGHKQYVMRLKVASNFITHLPTGSEVNAVMMFEDDSLEDAPEPNVPSEASETPVDKPTPLTAPIEPDPMETEAIAAAIDEPGSSEEEEDTPPDDMPDIPSGELAEEQKQVQEPPVEPKPAEVRPAVRDEQAEAPAPEPATKAEEKPAEAPPAEQKERVVTPQRRSKEAQLKQVCKQFAKTGNAKGLANWKEGGNAEADFKPGFDEADPESVIKFFSSGRGLADIEDAELAKLFGEVKEAAKQLESASSDDIPF